MTLSRCLVKKKNGNFTTALRFLNSTQNKDIFNTNHISTCFQNKCISNTKPMCFQHKTNVFSIQNQYIFKGNRLSTCLNTTHAYTLYRNITKPTHSSNTKLTHFQSKSSTNVFSTQNQWISKANHMLMCFQHKNNVFSTQTVHISNTKPTCFQRKASIHMFPTQTIILST